MGIQSEPVHASGVARVLDFETAIHDDREAALLRDPRAFGADYGELAPQRLRADGDSVLRDPGHGVRGAKYIDDVHRLRHVAKARVALLAEDLFFARVHGYHAVAVPLHVEADEVARAQRVVRKTDDRDGLRVQQHALNRARVLVAREIEFVAHRVFSKWLVSLARANPCSRSQIRSSTSSIPTESRIVPGPTPAAASSCSSSCR